MSISTHKVEVVVVRMEKHPNADSLSIIPVFGYTCVGRTSDWKEGELAAWLPPDSLAPISRPEFSFLEAGTKHLYAEDSSNAEAGTGEKYARITARKFRGTLSYGLLVPAPEGSKVGDDVAEQLGVKHYDPPLKFQNQGLSRLAMGGEVAKGPNVYAPKYDVDSFQRYAKEVFVEGEPVVVTEKIHGANGRWVYHNGEYYCGSRTEWKREYPSYDHVTVESLLPKLIENLPKVPEDKKYDPQTRAEEIVAKVKSKTGNQNMWWQALEKHPELKEWLKLHPDHVVYGEVYGAVQDMRYGHGPGQVSIAVFDILVGTIYLDTARSWVVGEGLPWVPTLAALIYFDFDVLIKLAEGDSKVPGANHIREGCVVKPLKERTHPDAGRVQLKVVNPAYLGKE